MDANQVVGSLLLGGRLAASMTVEDAASGSGLSVDRVLDIERGNSDVAITQLLPLLRTYRVSFGLFAAALEVAFAAQAWTSPIDSG